jgi:hypothetical protein
MCYLVDISGKKKIGVNILINRYLLSLSGAIREIAHLRQSRLSQLEIKAVGFPQ